MSEATREPCPDTTCDRLVERFGVLLETLHAERAALVDRSPETLQEVVGRKEALCGEIDREQQQLLAHIRAGAPAPAAIGELRDLARRCRHENVLNGRIANRARHTTKTLLAILTGEPPSDVYRPSGQELLPAPPSGAGHRLGSA